MHSSPYAYSAVPGLADDISQGVQKGKFRLSGVELSKIFQPVITKTIILVQEQMRTTERSVKAVLLVGGFGQSPYLREMLKKALNDDTEVMVPGYG